MLICSRCSLQVRGISAADVPANGIVCRCGHRLLPKGLKIDPGPRRSPAPQQGPGTELAKLLKELGITGWRGCGCKSKIAKMNRWGPAVCREHAAEILAWLADASLKTPLTTKLKAATAALTTGLALQLNPADPLRSLLNVAIASAESRDPPLESPRS